MTMLRGSITEEDRNFVETWENVSRSKFAIVKLDARGDERREIIAGPRTFMLTTEDRLITQDKIILQSDDPFLNGSFRPVVVPESVKIESNPNALSDSEIVSLLSASDFAWEEWMDTISSVQTVARMLDAAKESDDMPMKRFRQLEAKFAELKPQRRVEQRDRAAYEGMG